MPRDCVPARIQFIRIITPAKLLTYRLLTYNSAMPLSTGDVLHDRYRIEGQLGKGGMGAVYLAHDLTLDIRVAVKENLNLNPESERQFRREARMLAELRHPNLPRVTDHFIIDDRQYLVMDYIAGVDLHTRSIEKPPSVEEVVAWGAAACDALSYLHHLNPPIIHRDIKPANLKLQPDGRVVLVDFGIAKVFDQSQTTTGARGLTPGFSPPEQYGDQRTDATSDQYSLAATIYALITSQRPADSIKRMLGKETLRPASSYNPAVPPYLDATLERGLALDKDQRFPSIDDFQHALRGDLQLETIRAPLRVEPPPAGGRRRGLLLGGGAFALIVIGAGLVLGLSGRLPLGSAESSPTSTSSIPVAAVLPNVTASPSSTAIPSETPTKEPSSTPTEAPSPTATTFSLGGGGRIAFVSDREDGRTLQIWSMNGDGTDLRQVTFGPGDKSQPRWSPDGLRLLYVAPGGRDLYGNELGLDIFLINLDGSLAPVNLTQSIGDDSDPAWSPDGKSLAFTSTRVGDLRQVYLVDLDCQPPPGGCSLASQPHNLSAGYAVEYFPAWSPDGLRLAVAASINQAPARILMRPSNGDAPSLFDLQDRIRGAEQIAWSSDGKFLAFSWLVKRGKQEIYIASTDNPGLDPIALTNSLGNKEPAFSPNGQWIVFTSTRDQNPEIYLMTTNGTGQKNLTQNPGRDLQPDWQPLPGS
jgi:serine/threonine protein kinase/Tol biopolymer transport system component